MLEVPPVFSKEFILSPKTVFFEAKCLRNQLAFLRSAQLKILKNPVSEYFLERQLV